MEKKMTNISVRPSDKEELRRIAESKGHTLSSYIRYILAKEIEKEKEKTK